jgi:hypothetical protein
MPKYPEFKSKLIIGLEEEDWGKMTAGHFNRVINTDWKAARAKVDYKTIADRIDYKARTAKTNYESRTAKIDYKALQEKRITNTDFKARSANTDFKARSANTDWKARSANTDYSHRMKSIIQYDKQGNFIKEWDSAKEASTAMGKPGSDDIGAVCRGRQKTAYGFIWKFANEEQKNP